MISGGRVPQVVGHHGRPTIGAGDGGADEVTAR
jgi:hypothetical protein